MSPDRLPRAAAADTHDTLVQQALAASQADDAATAVTLFRRAIDADPGVASTHMLLGAELAQAGRDAEAESAYAAALWVAPTLHVARFQLGLLQLCGARAMAALLTWQPLFALPEGHALRSAVQGIAALLAGDPQGAVRQLREAIAHCQDNPPLAGDLARIVAALGEAPQASATVSAPASASTSESATASSSAHVLLANYRPDSPGH